MENPKKNPNLAEVIKQRTIERETGLLNKGIKQKYIIYVLRNKRFGNHESDTRGKWFYKKEDYFEFIDSSGEFLDFRFSVMDGSDIQRMENKLFGAIQDDPYGWKEHKEMIEKTRIQKKFT